MQLPKINNLKLTQLSSLQLFQLMRYGTMFLNSVLMSNFLTTVNEVSAYETLFLYGATFYTFWLSGINNTLFPQRALHGKKIYFNTFLVLCLFSVVSGFAMMGYAATDNTLPNQLLLQHYAVYTIVNAATYLTEYILILEQQYLHVLIYAAVIFVLQTLCNIVPAILKMDLFVVVHALLVLSVAKLIYVLFILKRFSVAKFEKLIVVHLVNKSSPVMLSLLFSGTIDFSNGYLIRHYLGNLDFARYRAGAREFPIFLIMTNTLSNVLSGHIAAFNTQNKLHEGLLLLRKKTTTLIRYLFPIAIILLFISKYIFALLYFKKPEFVEGYKVFNILLLLLVSRFLYPQTVLLGLHKNKPLAYTSIIEFVCIFILAWALILPFGIYGVAFATVFGFYIEKIILLYFCKKEGVTINTYLDVKQWAIYSLILWAAFMLVFFV
jgi:O-antigen/teichoic acid export membrane protein